MGQGPWWGSGALALLGALGGGLLTFLLNRWQERARNRREDRWRWADKQLTACEEFVAVARELERVPVWPTGPAAEDLLRKLRETGSPVVTRVRGRVAGAATEVQARADELVQLITAVRHQSRPGHQDSVDSRWVERYEGAVQGLAVATDEFLRAVWRRLGIEDEP